LSICGEILERISNANSTSILSVAEGWIFFANRDSDTIIYRIRTDGTEFSRLNQNPTRGNIIVYDGWVYYRNHSLVDASLFRIRIDGSGHERVVHDIVGFFNVFDGWIYYAGHLSENMYKIRTNGADRQKLAEGIGFDINIVDEWVYFRAGNWYELDILGHILSPLYRMRKDGTDRELVHSSLY
jgi:hypothetical protein